MLLFLFIYSDIQINRIVLRKSSMKVLSTELKLVQRITKYRRIHGHVTFSREIAITSQSEDIAIRATASYVYFMLPDVPYVRN